MLVEFAGQFSHLSHFLFLGTFELLLIDAQIVRLSLQLVLVWHVNRIVVLDEVRSLDLAWVLSVLIAV